MANPSTTYFRLTGDDIIDATTNGYRWNLNSDRTVDFAVANGFGGEYWNDIRSVNNHMADALSTVSYYADIKFTNLGNFNDPSAAHNGGSEITLSLDASGVLPTNTWAVGFFPNSNYNTLYNGAAGDLFLNVNSAGNYLPSYEPGSQGWFLLLHELGHTLGLKHPHDDGGTGRPTFESLGMNSLDIDLATVMSYNDDGAWNQFSWDPSTPMLLDVYALQYLYGKNLKTNSGNETFYLKDDGYYQTYWDASGIDTIDVSSANNGWSIYMPNVSLSTLVDTKAGYAMPSSEMGSSTPDTLNWLMGDFENLNGSRFADNVTGNLFDNVIRGNGGNDLINGGAGLDVCVYSGISNQYEVDSAAGIVTDKHSYRDGVDTLSNVERLQFLDRTVALDTELWDDAGSAYRLYKAAFDRAPDEVGLGYWIEQLDDGASLDSAASGFIQSAEFSSLYGSNISDAFFLTQLYNNVLDRNPDQAGLNYWVNQFNGGLSRESALINFSESSENVSNVADAISNGIVYQPWLG